jgi:PAS domain S-box-containing protein
MLCRHSKRTGWIMDDVAPSPSVEVPRSSEGKVSDGAKALEIPAWLPEKWQTIVDTVAELASVPAGLVMRIVGENLEVFVSSRTIGNPYHPGEAMRMADSGLYCEQVIRTNARLSVPNALADEDWKDNPDIALGMISYLGVPIRWPDEHPFGTLCILDDKERSHAELFERLLIQFRDIIEHHLSLLYHDAQRELAVQADRKRHDDALRSSEQRFRLLVEHAAEDFILHDRAGRILDANHQACRNSGMAKDELCRATILDLPIRFGDGWNEAIWSAAQPGDTAVIEAAYRLTNDQVAPVEIRWCCQLMQGEKLFLILIRDVSERHRAEEVQRAAEADLARAARLTMMGQLAGSIVHEVNQPLTAIATSARACLRWLDRNPPDIEEAVASARLITRSAEDAADIVAGLRSVAQKSAPTKAEIQINEIIGDALFLTRREYGSAQVERTINITDAPTTVIGDRTQIKQVILNLVLNAIEAMREVRDRPRQLRITSAHSEDGKVLVMVEDNGTGLLGQSSSQLFEPLFTTKAKGMGMGLAICRSIAEAHGGAIWAEDRSDGPGARFCLSLPAAG